MKKILISFLCLIMVLGLCGCGGNKTATVTDNEGNTSEMTASELRKINNENEAKFGKYYIGADIELEGTVKNIETYFKESGGGYVYDSIELKEGWIVYVWHNSIDLADLDKNTKVYVKSNIYGVTFGGGSVRLQGCENYQHSAPLYGEDDIKSTIVRVIE